MGFHTAQSALRPKGAGGAKTSMELMASSGLKYIHATKKGFQGIEGDLERSRKAILELGYVCPENVGGDMSEYRYHTFLSTSSVLAQY